MADLHTEGIHGTIEECLTNGEFKIIMDLKNVPYMDSKGLESLIDAQELLKKKGGDLKIAHPNPICKDILIATRLTEHFEIFEDMAVAGRSFR